MEDVYNWDFPVMGLTTGLKVHRMDFTLACIRFGSIFISEKKMKQLYFNSYKGSETGKYKPLSERYINLGIINFKAL